LKSLTYLLVQLGAIGLLAAEPVAKPDATADPKVDARYPYRVSWANDHLPWYQLAPGKFPPDHSDRRYAGELVKVDAASRSGQYRKNSTGELVDFTMLPFGTARYLNSECDLRDIPVGTQMLFFLYEDEQGKLTRVSQMIDDYTILTSHGWTQRLDAVDLKAKRISVTKQKLAKDQLDLGKSELLVDEQTRIWKGDDRIKLEDLALGDLLVMNVTGKTAVSAPRCTDIWVGTNTHAQVTLDQWSKRTESMLKEGLPAWVEDNKNGELSVMLFSNAKKDFKAFVTDKFKPGKEVSLVKTDDRLRSSRVIAVTALRELKTVPIEGYGSSGVQMIFDTTGTIFSAKPGTFVRVVGHRVDDMEAKIP
jgi:hypothetical protein